MPILYPWEQKVDTYREMSIWQDYGQDLLTPEQDEQGTLYGYKILGQCYDCFKSGHFALISPQYASHWSRDGELKADATPSEKHNAGIHFVKNWHDLTLYDYVQSVRRYLEWQFDLYYDFRNEKESAEELFSWRLPVLVRCALSGTVIETERGFRAEQAVIVGLNFVLKNVRMAYGDWTSYQEAQESAESYYRKYTQTRQEVPWQTEWRYGFGTDWDTNPHLADPKA